MPRNGTVGMLSLTRAWQHPHQCQGPARCVPPQLRLEHKIESVRHATLQPFRLSHRRLHLNVNHRLQEKWRPHK